MKYLSILASAVWLAAPLSLSAQEVPPPPKPVRDAAAADAKPAPVEGPLTRGLAGPYLAARAAAIQNDYDQAGQYYLRALEQDQGNGYLTDSALVSLISAGQMELAVALSQRGGSDGQPTQLGQLVARGAAARSGKWAELIEMTAPSTDDAADKPRPGGPLLDGMIHAWALLGAGRANEAILAFEKLEEIRGARGIVDYHLALAKATVGDYEGAATLLSGLETAEHLPGITARAQVLAQLDRRDEAIAGLKAQPQTMDEPDLVALLARLEGGEPVSFDVVNDPRDGIAQVFLTFASVISLPEEPNPLALIHARLAAWLAPDMPDARLKVAELLMDFGQFDAAEAEFAALRDAGTIRPAAEMARIDALGRAGRTSDAETAALALTTAYPEIEQAWIALGDLLRQQDKFTQGIPAYSKALELIGEDDARRWFPLFARGICFERSGQFPRAETDLRAALELQPENASILNYLGYSYVDRNQNLDEALDLITRAVEQSPNDGYILDSLAWAHYRMGNFSEAVAPMERAAEAMSNDSLVNDHLGDVYWMVGRKREAEIQWQRALSFGPEKPEEAARIRDKLERGLDAVIADERRSGMTDTAPTPPVPDTMSGMTGTE